MKTWVCRLCWKHGEFMVDLPEDEARRQASMNHTHLVGLDVSASRVPTGMDERVRNSPLMDKFPGVECPGQIILGYPKETKRVKFDKKQNQSFDFEVGQ